MFEVGRSKRAQQAFAFDDISIVPSRRTRGDEEVSLQWRIDAYTFAFPLIAAPMDSVMSPETAIRIGQLGGLGVLNLEGLWTRYDEPQPLLEEIAGVEDRVEATRTMQAIYAEPIKPELIGKRVAQIREAGVPAAGSLSPQNTSEYAQAVVDSGVDFFVIRGTTVSAEHVSTERAPLNLKQFIYDLDVPVIVGGCATYQAALHLMRTGAAGVLVGFGGGAAYTTQSGLHGRVGRTLRARDRRRVGRPVRRHRQGDRLRGRRGDGRFSTGQGGRGSGAGLPLGSGGLARQPAPR
jgi:IMP dehydrogenase